MSFIARLQRAREILEQQGRLSTRALERELETGGDELEELIEELVDVQQVARREGKILIWTGGAAIPAPDTSGPSPRTPPSTQRAADQGQTRKVISIIFADLMGSTALHEELDPESVNRVMNAYYASVRGPVEAAGGTVVALLGDGVLCAFGIPQIAEDDALRAVRAAVGIQQAFREFLHGQQGLQVPIGLRVAVNTGEVVVSDEHPAGIGDPLNVAARLQQEARDGEVLIGQGTRRLVAEAVTLERAGTFALKGRAETVTAYRVLSLERPTGTTAAFVGRDEELARLTAVYETARDTPAARLAVLLGSPGLGKSRLIDELGHRVGDAATVIAAQCDAAGGATFAPVAEALRQFLGERSDPTDQQSVLAAALAGDAAEGTRIIAGITAVLAGSPPSPEEAFFVIRRFLTALAREKPVLLVIDDLQWAEPLLLDLVEHLVQWGSGVPLFVLVGARPELRNRRSSLATAGGFVSDVLTLSGLDAGAAMRLAANVIGATDLPAAVVAKVLATSEGNPLFVGELVRMLVDEGAIEKQGERWIVGANLAALEMPPTIHALLASRLERLRPEERTVLERASVVGRQFSRGALAELLGDSGSALDARLEALRRTELIEPDTGWMLGEPVLRFHHGLIRDAAYRRLLKGTRAELHERLANWMEAQVRDAPEHDETIGRHLEQARQLLGEIGPLDARGKTLGERAAQRLSDAGRRALERDDAPVAADLLGRAIACLNWGDAQGAGLPSEAAARKGALSLDWCEALLSAGDVGLAARAVEELGRFAGAASTDRTDPQLSRLRAWHTCFGGHLTVMTAPQELQTAADAVAAAAAEFTELGDAAGEAKAHFVHALALSRLGRVGACEAALDLALAGARRAGDRRRANTVLAIAPLAALWGPSPVTRASGRCLDVVRVLRITQGAPAVEAVALSCQGVLEALRGRTEAAHRMIASGRKMVEELGIAQRLFETDVFAGFVAMLEGDAPAAERTLRCAYDGLRELGLGIDAARAAALLARALLAQDRSEEAEALSHESEALAGDDLKAAIAWRGVRAEALAKRGEHTEAIELARAAVAIAASTDALLDHADARLALAAALRAAGRDAEADAEDRQATDLWAAKGATLLAERARRGSSPAAPPIAAPAPPVAQPSRRRPVRPNFAIEEARRAEAAVAARDAQALENLYRRDVEIVDHQFGVEYGHDAIVERVRLIIQESTDGAFGHEALATLGDFVALCRLHSTASGSLLHDVPSGATESTYLLVIEADEEGRARRIDIFGENALRDAVVRLYERHAALLPERSERTRAAATAQSMAVLSLANGDPERLAPALAPDIEGVDHRHLSNWSLRGAPAYLDHLRALRQVADDVDFAWKEVLAVSPEALLTRVLHRGTERVGGGAYERSFLSLFAVGADGRITRAEWFDDDRETEALARFDALGEGWTSSAPRRLVRPNAASTSTLRFQAALAARDLVAFRALIPDGYHEIDHSTGTEWGREGGIASIERLFRSHAPIYELETLATMGERLALNRRRTGAGGDRRGRYDVGPYEHVAIQLAESDTRGLVDRQETFAHHRLGDAIVRLYERHADLSPEGPAREQAAATARTVAALLGPADLDAWQACLAAGVEFEDHRILGFGSLRGREAALPLLESSFEMSESLSTRIDDVLALEPGAFLVHWTESGVAPGGGDFERVQLTLWMLDGEGLVARVEYFDVDREADAIARFEALTGGQGEGDARPSPADRGFSNSATLLNERFARAWAERDWDTVSGAYVAGHHVDDRRRLMQMRLPDGDARTALRFLFDVPGSRWIVTPLATRGEHLVVSRYVFEGTAGADAGPIAIDYLAIDETNADGRFVETVLFDPDDFDAAYAELDRRYGAGEGRTDANWEPALRLRATLSRGDIDACRAMLAPGFHVGDHRKLGWGDTLRDAETFLQAQLALSELSPDWRYRIDHHRARGLVSLGQQAQVGTREGGAFENPFVVVSVYDPQGLTLSFDIYDVDQLEEARARYEELTGAEGSSAALDAVAPLAIRDSSRPRLRVWNRADAFRDRIVDAWHARDWAAIEGMLHEDFRFSDRRPLFLLDLDRNGWIDMTRQFADMDSARLSVETVATRGERLVLFRVRIEVADGDVGPSVVESLNLWEADEQGERLRSCARFEATDVATAYAELDERFMGEGTAGPFVVAWLRDFAAALEQRDWDAVAAMYARDFVGQDHRLVSWDTLRGPIPFLETFRVLVDLAPDARIRTDHLRASRRGILADSAWMGTRDGGAFESPFVSVLELTGDGRARRLDFYDPHHIGLAFARFREIAGRESLDPDLAAAMTPDAAAGVPEAASSMSPLHLPPNAAMRAMGRWFDAYERAFETGSLDGLRRGFHPGFVFDDRRRMALLHGGLDLMVASATERAGTGARPEWHPVGFFGDRVFVQRVLWAGGPPEGRFEIEYLGVAECDENGLLTAFVLFDLDDARAAQSEAWARWAAIEPGVTAVLAPVGKALDAFNEKSAARMDAPDLALARFEELRPPSPALPSSPGLRGTGGREDALQVPPNAATRGIDRWVEASLAGDADAVVALLDRSYTLEDRRPLFRTVSDRHAEIAVHLSLLHDEGWQPARTVLATIGDRLALQRWLWTKGESDARSEIEFLEIDELGDSGRFVRSILFAPEDRAAASRELLERYIATGADGSPHGSFETMRGWNEHDLVRVRGGLSDDFVLDDHRLAGMGRLEGPDAYIESVAALFELIPDARTEFLYFVAVESHGRVSVNRNWGLNREGGEVESVFVLLSRFRNGKVSYFELFELEHLDVALARLADLRLERTNAATRARDRQASAFVARDWDAVRRLATSDFVYEDRGKRALVTGDVEAWVASMQFTSQPGWRPRSTLLGTFGNHIALDRVVWCGEPGGDAFEFERLRVLEADADGHMRAVILFDPEDRLQASNEALARFVAAENAAPLHALLAWAESQRAKRWDDLRTLCTPDFVAVDRRPLGVLGTLDREQWAESLKAIDGLSDGLTYAVCDVLAWNDSAIVLATARHGSVQHGGGDIDDGFLAVWWVADRRVVRLDVFAEDDTEGALACFEEQHSRG